MLFSYFRLLFILVVLCCVLMCYVVISLRLVLMVRHGEHRDGLGPMWLGACHRARNDRLESDWLSCYACCRQVLTRGSHVNCVAIHDVRFVIRSVIRLFGVLVNRFCLPLPVLDIGLPSLVFGESSVLVSCRRHYIQFPPFFIVTSATLTWAHGYHQGHTPLAAMDWS